jgi:hypothetical protein
MTAVTAAEPTIEVRRLVGEMLEQQRWPRERLEALQHDRLHSLVRHAVDRSPYYRDALGEDAPDRPLDSFPTLPKRVLVERFEDIVTDPRLERRSLERFVEESAPGELFDGRYRVFTTSGTTGVRALVVHSPAEFAHWVAVGLARRPRGSSRSERPLRSTSRGSSSRRSSPLARALLDSASSRPSGTCSRSSTATGQRC